MIQLPTPKVVQIETTLACNAECPFCSHSTLTRRPRRMEDWLWKKIIDETRGLGITYRPFLINEPLADHRLGEIMRYIRRDDTAKIEINSNGELMREEKAKEILDAGIDIIRFSIDGFSKETFSKSRVGLDYDLTVERVTRFVQMARERGGAGHVEVRMIAMDYNRHEHEPFVEYWTKVGAVAVITDLYVWPWEPEVKPVQLPCKKVLKEMFFYVNGKATLCCWDSHERGVIGDATHENVIDIWNGELNRRYRGLLAEGRRREILLCSNCEAYKGHYFEGFPAPVASHA
jgi:sulfatase maturation enzyme AslB (radical SAM superfamily)